MHKNQFFCYKYIDFSFPEYILQCILIFLEAELYERKNRVSLFGGLDTSVIIPWLKENYNDAEVIAVCRRRMSG